MNIIVTGGAGFIGSHLVDYLLADGHHVTVVDNFLLGKKSNLSSAMTSPDFILYEEDLLNMNQLNEIFQSRKFDLVFHMAANSDISKSHHNPDVDFQNTFMTTYNVLKAMKENTVDKIVFASTSAIYGDSLGVEVDENHSPLFPISHYGAAKLSGESFISSFSENYGIQSWILRFPNVVGSRATHGVILDFITRLQLDPSKLDVLGNGTQYKSFLYVTDLVEAIIYIWKNSHEKINYFNVGVDGYTKVSSIVTMVLKEMQLKIPVHYQDSDRGWVGDVPKVSYNLDKIHALGWHAKYSSDEAVSKAIQCILMENTCN